MVSADGSQELWPILGLRPWLAFFRRTLAFFFWVLFDIARTGYTPCPTRMQADHGWPLCMLLDIGSAPGVEDYRQWDSG